MNICLTEEQFKKVLDADNDPIPYFAIQQFLDDVKNIKEVIVYELS